MEIQKGRSLHDSLINTMQQLHHHLSVSVIKVRKGSSLHDFLILARSSSYIIIDQFQLSKSKTEN